MQFLFESELLEETASVATTKSDWSDHSREEEEKPKIGSDSEEENKIPSVYSEPADEVD